MPAYSRPRDGRTPTGRVAERRGPIPDRDGRGYYYSPYPYGYYYDPYGYYGSYWYPGYALGLGYFYYDPFWYGSYGSYGYGYQGGYGSGSYSYGEAGSLRLKIKPREAQVFVDGYFVGNVDSFDGVFQRLSIEAGAHKIEIRAPGYETLQFDVLVTPGDTVTYKGEMERIK
ncbi:MAG TPA: PEGA domain-containing protein [Vicinamibacterales bacterium]|nr:PEGA domain-containing protein [Vicinamibacterales bacterium]